MDEDLAVFEDFGPACEVCGTEGRLCLCWDDDDDEDDGWYGPDEPFEPYDTWQEWELDNE